MVKKFFKKKSKRVSTRTRVKIERKVREHNRQVKKDTKKKIGKRRSKKDPGVPNECPFKEEILKEAAEHKQRLEEERQKQKERAKKQRTKTLEKKRSLTSLVSDAEKRQNAFNAKTNGNDAKLKDYSNKKSAENSLKAYYKEFRKVVEGADVILEVLDARDPLGCRCTEVEEAVLAAGASKRLVLVLNKIDLVPRENVEEWLKYLRNEFPTVAFKACTQTQSDHLSQVKVPVANANADLIKSSRCLGADMLMKLIGNYARNNNIRTSVTVGVVGFPNTGKSSLINSLKRSKACNVGAMPGITKQAQVVQLDKHIQLLDSPGIVMANDASDSSIILKNCVKVETIDDPVPPVAAILKRCNKDQMMLHYTIPDYSDVHEFLSILAKRFGRLKKGGIPDTFKSARQVLQDWNQGRITYYTHPPESHSMQTHVSSEIVTQMGQEFDINSLLLDEEETLKGLKKASCTDFVVESTGPVSMLAEDEMSEDEDEDEDEEESDEDEEEMAEDSDEEEDMEEEEQELKKVTVQMKKPPKTPSTVSFGVSDPSEKAALESKIKARAQAEGNLQLNASRKKDFRKMKKDRKRADKLGGALSSALEDAFAGLGDSSKDGDDYEFSAAFSL